MRILASGISAWATRGTLHKAETLARLAIPLRQEKRSKARISRFVAPSGSDSIGFLGRLALGFSLTVSNPGSKALPQSVANPPLQSQMMNSQSHSNMHVSALQPSLSPQSVTRRATVANDGEMYHHRASHATIERAPCTSNKVDVQILKKLSASVSHFEGPRKNLSFVVSVETLIPGRRAFSDERESCQLVARSFDDFRRFRKSLLARVGSLHDPTLLLSGRSGKCRCEGVNGCPFDVTRSFLERLKFTRMPFLSLGDSEADLTKRQLEMDNFLHIIFAILHRMQPGSWHPECRFLQDVMAFLEVEESFSQQMELLLRSRNRHMSLDGWKEHTLETFGSGIGV